jgi:hypothetical protein
MKKKKKYQRSPEGEQRRLEAQRSPECRAKMSAAKKGKRPKNYAVFMKACRKHMKTNWTKYQSLAWEANRKEFLTYSGMHSWIRRTWGPASAIGKCDQCGKSGLSGRQIHWANKDHKYTRSRSDWMLACRPCHAAHDRDHNGVDFRNGRARRS